MMSSVVDVSSFICRIFPMLFRCFMTEFGLVPFCCCWSSILEFDTGVLCWSLMLKFSAGVRCWCSMLEFDVGVLCWSLLLEFVARLMDFDAAVWCWSLMLKFDAGVCRGVCCWSFMLEFDVGIFFIDGTLWSRHFIAGDTTWCLIMRPAASKLVSIDCTQFRSVLLWC